MYIADIAQEPPARGLVTCRGCRSGKLGRAGWHAALTGKAGTCQLRQTPWHTAQTVSARLRSCCWSLLGSGQSIQGVLSVLMWLIPPYQQRIKIRD
jgi:hypothetical protein